MEVYKPQENMEQLRKVAKEVNDYLEPILDEAFNLKLRTEYTDNNLNEWMRGMREVNDREKNLGVTDDVSEEKFFSTLNEFGETQEIIDGLKPPQNPLDMSRRASIISRIREIDKTGELEKNIKKIYGEDKITERHRHRLEVNNKYLPILKEKGLVVSGSNPDLDLVEISELKNHPYFIGCQYHPEFKSRPFKPHPLFKSFIEAAGLNVK